MYVCMYSIYLFVWHVCAATPHVWVNSFDVYAFIFIYAFIYFFPEVPQQLIYYLKKSIFELEVKHLTFYNHEINFYKRVKYNNTKFSLCN